MFSAWILDSLTALDLSATEHGQILAECQDDEDLNQVLVCLETMDVAGALAQIRLIRERRAELDADYGIFMAEAAKDAEAAHLEEARHQAEVAEWRAELEALGLDECSVGPDVPY